MAQQTGLAGHNAHMLQQAASAGIVISAGSIRSQQPTVKDRRGPNGERIRRGRGPGVPTWNAGKSMIEMGHVNYNAGKTMPTHRLLPNGELEKIHYGRKPGYSQAKKPRTNDGKAGNKPSQPK